MSDNLFDKFTERARNVLTLAQEESQRLNHHYIGTEHLLLGLVREGENVGARVLSNMSVDLSKVRSQVEAIIGRGNQPVPAHVGLTPRAKNVIEHAIEEARALNHHYIGTEHLLLGLVREGEGIAAGVLESLGVNLDNVRTEIIRILDQSSSYSSTPKPIRIPVSPAMTYTFSLAERYAQNMNSREAGLEHLLLSLLSEPESQAIQLLQQHGLRVDEGREALIASLSGDQPD